MALHTTPIELSGGPRYRTLHEGWVLKQGGAELELAAQVPGCVHADLRRAGKIEDPFFANNEAQLGWIEQAEWNYENTITLSSEEETKEHLELIFEGLDTLAEICPP